MISTRDGAALYLKTRRMWPLRIRTGGRLRDARTSLSLYSKAYGAVAAPAVRGTCLSQHHPLTSWRER